MTAATTATKTDPVQNQAPGIGGNLLTRTDLLKYEIYSAWWTGFALPKVLQELAAKYFAWKVTRKYARYLRGLEIAAQLVKAGAVRG